MDTFTEIIPNLYLGGYKALLPQGVTTIISIGEEYEIPNSLKKYYYELEDDSCSNITDLLYHIPTIIYSELENNSIIYIHCKFGQSRSVIFLIAFLMKYFNYSFESAYTLIANKRQIGINPFFVEQLKKIN